MFFNCQICPPGVVNPTSYLFIVPLTTVVKCFLPYHQQLGKVQILHLSLLLEMTALVTRNPPVCFSTKMTIVVED